MLKTKIFHFHAKEHDNNTPMFLKEMERHDVEINKFIEVISEEGHTFITLSQVGYGRYEPCNRLRTIIVYNENQKRKVIVEKKC
jgi:hypothetical protein